MQGAFLFGATCIYMYFACGTESATNSALVLPPRVAALLERSEVLLTRRTVVVRKKERKPWREYTLGNGLCLPRCVSGSCLAVGSSGLDSDGSWTSVLICATKTQCIK